MKELQQNFNQLHCDYMQMKHSYESVKFDIAQSNSNSSSKEGTPTKQQRRSPLSSSPVVVTMDKLPMHFTNPYAEDRPTPQEKEIEITMPALKYPNPYEQEGAVAATAAPITTQPTAPPMSVSPATANEDSLLTPAYPPDLPEPLQPKVMPEAKIAAIKSVTRNSSSSDISSSGEPIRDVPEER